MNRYSVSAIHEYHRIMGTQPQFGTTVGIVVKKENVKHKQKNKQANNGKVRSS